MAAKLPEITITGLYGDCLVQRGQRTFGIFVVERLDGLILSFVGRFVTFQSGDFSLVNITVGYAFGQSRSLGLVGIDAFLRRRVTGEQTADEILLAALTELHKRLL